MLKKIIFKTNVLVGVFFVLIFGIGFFLYGINKSDAVGKAGGFGGRIMSTMNISQCSNPMYGAINCPLCSSGAWYQVVIQPSGGDGFYFCPTTAAIKGNNSNFMPGGYVIAGGMSTHAIDINNTSSVMGRNEIRGRFMLAWFRLKNLFS